MTGSLLQLVAKGYEDNILTKEAEISFFKTVFRRHTNFSKYPDVLKFREKTNFGSSSSCTLKKDGDLLTELSLLVDIDDVYMKYNSITYGDLINLMKKYGVDNYNVHGNNLDDIVTQDYYETYLLNDINNIINSATLELNDVSHFNNILNCYLIMKDQDNKDIGTIFKFKPNVNLQQNTEIIENITYNYNVINDEGSQILRLYDNKDNEYFYNIYRDIDDNLLLINYLYTTYNLFIYFDDLKFNTLYNHFRLRIGDLGELIIEEVYNKKNYITSLDASNNTILTIYYDNQLIDPILNKFKIYINNDIIVVETFNSDFDKHNWRFIYNNFYSFLSIDQIFYNNLYKYNLLVKDFANRDFYFYLKQDNDKKTFIQSLNEPDKYFNLGVNVDDKIRLDFSYQDIPYQYTIDYIYNVDAIDLNNNTNFEPLLIPQPIGGVLPSNFINYLCIYDNNLDPNNNYDTSGNYILCNFEILQTLVNNNNYYMENVTPIIIKNYTFFVRFLTNTSTYNNSFRLDFEGDYELLEILDTLNTDKTIDASNNLIIELKDASNNVLKSMTVIITETNGFTNYELDVSANELFFNIKDVSNNIINIITCDLTNLTFTNTNSISFNYYFMYSIYKNLNTNDNTQLINKFKIERISNIIYIREIDKNTNVVLNTLTVDTLGNKTGTGTYYQLLEDNFNNNLLIFYTDISNNVEFGNGLSITFNTNNDFIIRQKIRNNFVADGTKQNNLFIYFMYIEVYSESFNSNFINNTTPQNTVLNRIVLRNNYINSSTITEINDNDNNIFKIDINKYNTYFIKIYNKNDNKELFNFIINIDSLNYLIDIRRVLNYEITYDYYYNNVLNLFYNNKAFTYIYDLKYVNIDFTNTSPTIYLNYTFQKDINDTTDKNYIVTFYVNNKYDKLGVLSIQLNDNNSITVQDPLGTLNYDFIFDISNNVYYLSIYKDTAKTFLYGEFEFTNISDNPNLTVQNIGRILDPTIIQTDYIINEDNYTLAPIVDPNYNYNIKIYTDVSKNDILYDFDLYTDKFNYIKYNIQNINITQDVSNNIYTLNINSDNIIISKDNTKTGLDRVVVDASNNIYYNLYQTNSSEYMLIIYDESNKIIERYYFLINFDFDNVMYVYRYIISYNFEINLLNNNIILRIKTDELNNDRLFFINKNTFNNIYVTDGSINITFNFIYKGIEFLIDMLHQFNKYVILNYNVYEKEYVYNNNSITNINYNKIDLNNLTPTELNNIKQYFDKYDNSLLNYFNAFYNDADYIVSDYNLMGSIPQITTNLVYNYNDFISLYYNLLYKEVVLLHTNYIDTSGIAILSDKSNSIVNAIIDNVLFYFVFYNSKIEYNGSFDYLLLQSLYENVLNRDYGILSQFTITNTSKSGKITTNNIQLTNITPYLYYDSYINTFTNFLNTYDNFSYETQNDIDNNKLLLINNIKWNVYYDILLLSQIINIFETNNVSNNEQYILSHKLKFESDPSGNYFNTETIQYIDGVSNNNYLDKLNNRLTVEKSINAPNDIIHFYGNFVTETKNNFYLKYKNTYLINNFQDYFENIEIWDIIKTTDFTNSFDVSDNLIISSMGAYYVIGDIESEIISQVNNEETSIYSFDSSNNEIQILDTSGNPATIVTFIDTNVLTELNNFKTNMELIFLDVSANYSYFDDYIDNVKSYLQKIISEGTISNRTLLFLFKPIELLNINMMPDYNNIDASGYFNFTNYNENQGSFNLVYKNFITELLKINNNDIGLGYLGIVTTDIYNYFSKNLTPIQFVIHAYMLKLLYIINNINYISLLDPTTNTDKNIYDIKVYLKNFLINNIMENYRYIYDGYNFTSDIDELYENLINIDDYQDTIYPINIFIQNYTIKNNRTIPTFIDYQKNNYSYFNISNMTNILVPDISSNILPNLNALSTIIYYIEKDNINHFNNLFSSILKDTKDYGYYGGGDVTTYTYNNMYYSILDYWNTYYTVDFSGNIFYNPEINLLDDAFTDYYIIQSNINISDTIKLYTTLYSNMFDGFNDYQSVENFKTYMRDISDNFVANNFFKSITYGFYDNSGNFIYQDPDGSGNNTELYNYNLVYIMEKLIKDEIKAKYFTSNIKDNLYDSLDPSNNIIYGILSTIRKEILNYSIYGTIDLRDIFYEELVTTSNLESNQNPYNKTMYLYIWFDRLFDQKITLNNNMDISNNYINLINSNFSYLDTSNLYNSNMVKSIYNNYYSFGDILRHMIDIKLADIGFQYLIQINNNNLGYNTNSQKVFDDIYIKNYNSVKEYYQNYINTLEKKISINELNNLIFKKNNFKVIKNGFTITKEMLLVYNNYDEYRIAYNMNKVLFDITEEEFNTIKNTYTKPLFKWVKKLGHRLIEKISLKINNQTIDSHNWEWIDIFVNLFFDKNQERGYNIMIGNTKELYEESNYNDDIYKNNNLVKKGAKLIIPIFFSCSRSIAHSLPMIALLHSLVEIELKLAKLEDVAIWDEDAEFIKKPEINCRILGHYIYVEEEERKTIAESKIEYIYDVIESSGIQTISNKFDNNIQGISTNIQLFYVNPSQFLVWKLRVETKNPTREQIYDWTNNKYIVDGQNVPIIEGFKIKFNGRDREITKDYTFYNNYQPYKMKCNKLNDNTFAYTFSLEPKDIQFSGSCNMGKLNDLMIQIFINPEIYDKLLNGEIFIKFSSYSYSLNILRIFSGIGALAYYG
jgi:hypothetical protein